MERNCKYGNGKGKETSVRSENGKRAAVITLSDKGYAGEREDKSGPLVKTMLEAARI